MTDIEAVRTQVIAQCRAVQHMAQAIADLHGDMIKIYASEAANKILEMGGNRTADFLEVLGDMLNGMDAVTEEDEWIDPIIEAAQKRWPQKSTSVPTPARTEEDGV